MGYLVSSTDYDQTQINTVLKNTTWLTISTDTLSQNEFLEKANFIFNRNNINEILYLIWDYTDRKPIANDDDVILKKGKIAIIEVTKNDSNFDLNTIIVLITNPPTNGTAVVNEDKTITYTHNNGYSTSDSFSYKLFNGICESKSATVNITISQDIFPFKWIGSEPYCVQETFVCLSKMEIILRYADDLRPTSDGLIPICAGGHNCNRADFYLQGNTTTIGNFSLNNSGGPKDLLNYPPGVTSGYNRYNSLIVTREQALEMASTSLDGFIDFKITPQFNNTNPHTGVTWIIFKLNDNIILQTCRDTEVFRVNPCTGQVIEV